VRGGDKEAVLQERLMNDARAMLEDGKPARMVEVADEDRKAWDMLQLLTAKPVLFVCNVAEDEAGEGNAHSAGAWPKWPPRRVPGTSSSPPRSRKRSRSWTRTRPRCS
jgi:ribosome-binding ATPase YchF (GTP1/OBG family)